MDQRFQVRTVERAGRADIKRKEERSIALEQPHTRREPERPGNRIISRDLKKRSFFFF